ncbi:PAS domain-containing sensor histidine kinase [Futiania mangrovi]|uniref:histidine kinase n=1 Tax=Futiania mangrovi TaxID=2959716 RepID=A0A9J6PF47_9PROT|nr:PAS domain-containing sensor histidine kinase [Futiania mangrovii]MCP1337337.1 PAS domain-containing sensor histidine kinase [Futiania mangrovii]
MSDSGWAVIGRTTGLDAGGPGVKTHPWRGLSVRGKRLGWTLGTAAVLAGALTGALAFAPGILPGEMAARDRGLAALGVGAAAATLYGALLLLLIASAVRQAQAAARARQPLDHFLVDHVADLILRQAPDGRITYASPSASAVLGASPEALAGTRLTDHAAPDEVEAMQTAFARAAYLGEDATLVCRMLKGDGTGIWTESHIRPVLGASPGRLREFIVVMRDITLRHTYERHLIEARDAAEAANRAKARFLSHMSHELRTPLNAIIGFSEVMRDELFGTLGAPRYRDYAAMIHDSGRQLLDAVASVLDMSRIEAGRYTLTAERFELAPLIADVISEMSYTAADRGIALNAVQAGGLPRISGDKLAIKQVLLNLVSNALKFTGRGGSVTVEAHVEGGRCEIAVTDTGVGIPEGALARLGRPFEQVSEQAYVHTGEGAGLGLAVARALVELHGGTIRIDSTLGEGTRVTVRLPALHAVGAGKDTGHAASVA